MKWSVQKLSSSIIFLHGISGAGKGEVQKLLERELGTRGYTVVSLSSGDLFRRRIKEDPGFAESMAKGNYAETLEPILPYLTEATKTHLTNILSGQKQILVLDGFLRVGSFESQSERNTRKISSQIDQVAEAMKRGIREVLSKEGSQDFFLRDYNRLVNAPDESFSKPAWRKVRKRIAEDLVRSAEHIFIDIPVRHAEALMRYRSEKALTGFISELYEKNDPALGRTIRLLEIARLIQQGKFSRTEKDSHRYAKRGLRLDAGHKGRTLGSINEQYWKGDIDRDLEHTLSLLQRTVMNVHEGGISFSKIATALEVKTKKELPRTDDIYVRSRLNRIREFEDKAKPGILEQELGIQFTEDRIVVPENRKITVITNDITGEHPYEQFLTRAEVAVSAVTSRIQLEKGNPVGKPQKER